MNDNGSLDPMGLITRLSPIVSFLLGISSIIANATNNPTVSYILLILCWLLVSFWLLRVWRQDYVIRATTPKEKPTPSPIYTDKQRRLAMTALFLITVVVWGWLGWQAWLRVRPEPWPDVTFFPEDKFGIIIAEFTQGAQERAVYPGGVDIRDILYSDLNRLVVQHELDNRISVQPGGPIKNQEQALLKGEKFGAELIVWGYTPKNLPNSFRPTFTIVGEKTEWQVTDATVFGVEAIGQDVYEATYLLTSRIRAITCFSLGLVSLSEGSTNGYETSIRLFDLAINEAEEEYNQHEEMRSDFAYNLALFYLQRGRAYTGLQDDDKALQDLDRAIEYMPNLARAFSAKGYLLLKNDQYDTAKDAFNNIKHKWYGQYGLGLVNYSLGDYGEAAQHFERARELAKDDSVLDGGETEMKLKFMLGMAYKNNNKNQWRGILSELCHQSDITSHIKDTACQELEESERRKPETKDLPLMTPTGMPLMTPPQEPLDCRNALITKYVFPQLMDVKNQFPFYWTLDEPYIHCQVVYSPVHSEPIAVNLEFYSPGNNFDSWGVWGIVVPDGYDATGYDQICFWAYAEKPAQNFYLQIRDIRDKEERLLISLEDSNEWTQFCKSLSDFADLGVRLDQVENFNIGFNETTGNATIWVDDFELK